MQTHGLKNDSPLQQLIRRAHRRALAHSVMAEAFTAGAVSLLGLALLLMAGTDYFPALLLWLFCTFGLGAAIYRWLRSRAIPYQVAQRLDSRWSTHDQISTAYHFLEHEAPTIRAASAQRVLAEEAARTQDVARALPFQLPGSARWLLAVALVTMSLWVLRYLLHPSLMLRLPLPALVAQALYGSENEHPSPGPTSPEEKLPGSPQTQVDRRSGQTGIDFQGDDVASPREADYPHGRLDAEGQRGASNTPSGGDLLPDQAAPTEAMAATDSLSPYAPQAAQPEAGSALAADSPDGDLGPWNPAPSSLLQRLQDLLQSMLATSDRKSADRGENPWGASPGAMRERHRRPGDGQNTSSGQDSARSPGDADQQASIDQVSVSSIEGAADQTTQAETQVGTAGQGDGSKQTSPLTDPAMRFSELAELYQRRADEIRGAFTIEATSSRQSALTPYSPKEASHHGAASAVSRDEIPTRYRPYIKAYFKHLR